MLVLLASILVVQIVLLVLFFNSEKKLSEQKNKFEGFEKLFRDEIARNRDDSGNQARQNREELSNNIKDLRDNLSNSVKDSNSSIATYIKDLSTLQSQQLENFAKNLQQMSSIIEINIKNLQADNNKQLEQMRVTVDEKLQSTLENRIALSFKEVSDRLEQVHKGLGEMQNLAIGVGDLKRVLTNVKTRGVWGEMQLASLLEQSLSPEQYSANFQIKNNQERVDFVIRLPGDGVDNPVYLPIDSKFPQEDYQRLLEAQEQGNVELAQEAIKQLETRIKSEAKSIRDKYICPPKTTDFALMFLPTEGLYAEVIRNTALVDKLQKEFRVTVVGPTTINALLNSLQMGFRTLTIQKRSSEVWGLLADIRKNFGMFSELLVKAHDRVMQASNIIEDAGKKSRTIENKLQKVQELPGTHEMISVV
jgi:DNA recombination protein RmuC